MNKYKSLYDLSSHLDYDFLSSLRPGYKGNKNPKVEEKFVL